MIFVLMVFENFAWWALNLRQQDSKSEQPRARIHFNNEWLGIDWWPKIIQALVSGSVAKHSEPHNEQVSINCTVKETLQSILDGFYQIK